MYIVIINLLQSQMKFLLIFRSVIAANIHFAYDLKRALAFHQIFDLNGNQFSA